MPAAHLRALVPTAMRRATNLGSSSTTPKLRIRGEQDAEHTETGRQRSEL